MWFMLCTRPDLAFTVSMLSKFNAAPTTEHLAVATPYGIYATRPTLQSSTMGKTPSRTQLSATLIRTLLAISMIESRHPAMSSC